MSGLSRHTVRSALRLLAAERLVTVEPYRGARVAQFDTDGLVALQQLRAALECEAVRLVRARHGTTWPPDVVHQILEALDRLERAAATDPDDWPEVARAHAEVHSEIVAAARSPRLTETYRSLHTEMLLVLVHLRPRYRAEALVAEHRGYLRLIQSVGEDAVRAHVDHATALILGALAAD